MRQIPISFTHKGKTYQADLSEVSGAAIEMWHLMINKRYRGALTFSSTRGWQFSSQKGVFPEWAEVFSKAVIEANPGRKFK